MSGGARAGGSAGGKAALRAILRTARAAVPAAERAAAGRAIAARVLALPEIAQVTVAAAFASLPDEPDTLPLLTALRERGVVVLLPVVLPAGTMEWARYEGAGTLVPGPHGVPAPGPAAPRRPVTDADLVLVPGVAFDPRGRRLGRGGGHYDRALAKLPPGVPVAGLAYDEAVVTEVPAEPHDVAVHLVVTPARVLRVATG